MDKLKELFGTEALTWEQLQEKLKDNKDVKLANLAAGSYVDKSKYDKNVAELNAANDTIKGLKDTVAKFDGVDVDKLKKDASDWENKYNTDIANVKLDNDIYINVVESKAKNPKLVMSLIDKSVIKRDGEKLLGLSEQLDKIKESDSYLFDVEQQKQDEGNQGGGATISTGANHNGTNNTINTFMTAFSEGAGLESKGVKNNG